MLPERVPSSSSAVIRLAIPFWLTNTIWPPNGPELIVNTDSPLLVPNSWLAATPRVLPATSPTSWDNADNARPSDVIAHTGAVVVVSRLAITKSWRPGVALLPPSSDSRPIWPDDDKVITQPSSMISVDAAGARSAGENVWISFTETISVRRSRP